MAINSLIIPTGLSATDQEATRQAYIAGGGLAQSISPSQLQNTQVANVPPAPALATAPVITPTQPYTPPATVESTNNNLQDLFKQYLGAQPAQPNLSAEYSKQAQTAGLEQKSQVVQGLTNQLTALDAQNTAALAQSESRNAPMFAIRGEQAQQQRNYAMAALPLQARLSAAQGDLQSAQAHVDKMFSIFAQDAQNQYDHQKQLVESVYQFATQQQQNILKQLETQAQNNFTLKRDLMSQANDLANTAFANGNSALGSKILGLDPNSQTYQQDVARLAGQITPKASKRDTQVVNGKLIDMQTGEVISNLDNPTSNALGNAIAELKVDNINNILNSKALDSVVGTSGLSRTEPGLWSATKRFFTGLLGGAVAGGATGAVFGGVGALPGAIIGGLTTGVVRSLQGAEDELTGDRQNFIGSVEQVTKQLTLDKLIEAKKSGATFGALSDGERITLAGAATKIGSWAIREDGKPDGKILGYDIDEASFKREMDTINYFTKLDAIIRGATPESVGAVTNPDGTVWIMNSDGTLTQLIRQ